MLRIEPGSTARAASALNHWAIFPAFFWVLRICFILFTCVLVSHSSNYITQLLIILKESLVKPGECGTNYLKLVFPVNVILTRPFHLWFLALDSLVSARSLYLTLQGFLRSGNRFQGIPSPMAFIHGHFSTEPWKWRLPHLHLKFLNLHCVRRTTYKSHSPSLTVILSPRPLIVSLYTFALLQPVGILVSHTCPFEWDCCLFSSPSREPLFILNCQTVTPMTLSQKQN